MVKIREVVESPLPQGADEEIVYGLDVTNWGAAPTTTSAKIYSVADDGALTDATATCMTGSTSVGGNVITLPLIHTLTAGTQYRVEVKFTIGSNIFEAYFFIEAEV
jgi:hypothetical protein